MKKWIEKKKWVEYQGTIFQYVKVLSESQDSGKTGEFDLLRFSHWVNIVALDDEENVVMVKQYRHGNDSITLELPGGAVDLGEDHKKAAARELQEETGYTTSEELIEIGTTSPNPSFMTNFCKTYLAKNCVPSSNQNLDELEEIEVVKIPLKSIPEKIESGEIDHSLIVTAFMYYSLYEKKVNFS